jgi:hypothetical protein
MVVSVSTMRLAVLALPLAFGLYQLVAPHF